MSAERFSVVREPVEDDMADVRVSLGRKRGLGAYLVFRGDPEGVVALLEDAAALARAALPAGRYIDRRGRPQG